jgi:hypothetical protein
MSAHITILETEDSGGAAAASVAMDDARQSLRVTGSGNGCNYGSLINRQEHAAARGVTGLRQEAKAIWEIAEKKTHIACR